MEVIPARKVLSDVELTRLVAVLKKEYPNERLDDIGIALLTLSMYYAYVANQEDPFAEKHITKMRGIAKEIVDGILYSLNVVVAGKHTNKVIQ